jgi:hypothetical protein
MKLHLLKDLFDLNQALEQVLTGLERMEGSRFFHREEFRYMRAEIESVRVHANREFFGRFEDIVEKDALWAYKFRRAYDKRMQDPFDLYLEIKEREETRRRKGLPPRVVLLPDWDKDDEERYEREQGEKRELRRKKRKKTARAHKRNSNAARISAAPLGATIPEKGLTDD